MSKDDKLVAEDAINELVNLGIVHIQVNGHLIYKSKNLQQFAENIAELIDKENIDVDELNIDNIVNHVVNHFKNN